MFGNLEHIWKFNFVHILGSVTPCEKLGSTDLLGVKLKNHVLPDHQPS